MVHKVTRRQALERLLEVATLLGEGMEADAAGRGLSVARVEVLWVLQHRGPLRQCDLADFLRVSPRNITGLVDGLEASGFAARHPHPSDRRAFLVSLTDTGRALTEALVADQDDFASFLFEGMRDAQLDELSGLMGEVVGRLRSPDYAEVRAGALQRWSTRQAAIDEHRPTEKAAAR